MISNESLQTVTQIVVGGSVFCKPLYNKITYDLSAAIQQRTHIHANVVNDAPATPLKNNSILIGNSATNAKTRILTNASSLNLPSGWSSQSFVVQGMTNATGSRFLLVFGNDSLGDTYGVYWLIEQILYGEEATGDLFRIK